MDQNQAFLESIRDHPENNDLKRIYADWLEGRGNADRAELIRVQHRISELKQQEQQLLRNLKLEEEKDKRFRYCGLITRYDCSGGREAETLVRNGIFQQEPISAISINISYEDSPVLFKHQDWQFLRKLRIYSFGEVTGSLIDRLLNGSFKNLRKLEVERFERQQVAVILQRIAADPKKFSSIEELSLGMYNDAMRVLISQTRQAIEQNRPIPFPHLSRLNKWEIKEWDGRLGDEQRLINELHHLRQQAHELGLDRPELYEVAPTRSGYGR